jgi:hypothetical protein
MRNASILVPLLFSLLTFTSSADSGFTASHYNLVAGEFSYAVTGAAGGRIEASTNLVDWIGVVTVASDGSFTNNDSAQFEWRYYRIHVGNEVSTNVIGYIVVPMEANKTYLLGNPFENGSLRWPDFAGLPNNAQLFIWSPADGAFLPTYTWVGVPVNRWSPSEPSLGLHDAFYLRLPSAGKVVFWGELPPSPLTLSAPKGLSLIVPVYPTGATPGGALQIPAQLGTQIYVFDETISSFKPTMTYINGWHPQGEPLKPGRGFWLRLAQGQTWSASYP